MAGSYRGSAKRTGSDSIASRKSPTVGDVLSRSNSYNDPKESDLEEVMADLMSNDLPFSVRYPRTLGEPEADCGHTGSCGVTGVP